MSEEVKPTANSCIIYLVRHGATEANLARPYILQGCTMNLPLSATGRRQLLATSRRLSHEPIDAVYCSYLRRACESAELIAQPHNLPVQEHEGIHEVHVGEWEGLSWDKIALRDPEYYAEYIEDTALKPYKGGESYLDVSERVLPSIHRLGSMNVSRTIVLVAHNIVNRVIVAHALELQLSKAKDLKQSNGCVNILRWEANKLTMITMNEISHLQEV